MPEEKQLKVMISSTVHDLEGYRAKAKDACLDLQILPHLMGHRPAQDADAIKASIKMVNESDIYVGIFAHRYGYIPGENNPKNISITEMEYDQACELEIPRLIFLMDDDYAVKPSNVDKGKDAAKLEKFKKRLKKERVVKFFTTPDNLHANIISALTELINMLDGDDSTDGSDLPAPPEEYVAHPYVLFQTDKLIGRRAELELLNEWVSNSDSDLYKRQIFSFVAIGGLGKSALTWKWFSEIAPEKMKPLVGRIWWSFYDRDAYFENFVLHALAYVSRSPVEVVREISPQEREVRLLAALNQNPYLLVLDGFERELSAYARMDPALLDDADVEIHGNARKTTDPRVGQFLKKLAQVKKSRILISTRLLPRELENEVDDPLPGVFRFDLGSLLDEDAVSLWQALGVDGSPNILLPLFRQFDKHTILIQAVAGEVKRFRRAPGDLEKWLAANPKFEPAKHPRIKERAAHVLEFALQGLNDKERNVLATIVAFRFPPSYDTLAAILTGNGKSCSNDDDLNEILSDLENRGLIGWDKSVNRYDLHPIVRGVVWNSLSDDTRQNVYRSLHAYFEAMPEIEFENVNSLEDLTPAIELYNALIGLCLFDEALFVFYKRLSKATLYRLSASLQRVELLEMLFPDGVDNPPRLSRPEGQGYLLNTLALGFQNAGQPGRAIPLYHRGKVATSEPADANDISVCLVNLSETFRATGNLRASEEAARQALVVTREEQDHFVEAASLEWLGLALAAHGEREESELALRRSKRIWQDRSDSQGEGVVNAYLAQRSIWFGNYSEALVLADLAWNLSHLKRLERDVIRAARVQGQSIGVDDLATADERLHHALRRARAVNYVEEELPALTALAELRRRQSQPEVAREFLEDVWEYAERGPYPLFHADALNVLAQIEIDAGNIDKAIEAATEAYKKAWCDGPPYAYHWGLEKAKNHLTELDAPFPDMPEFDESRFEPMPEVEIDPDDEFHVGDSSESS